MDHRDSAGDVRRVRESFIEDSGCDTRWAICDTCEGEGKHVNPNIDRGGISDFDDPDFEEGYHTGRYDIACNGCGGSGKVQVPADPSDCIELQKGYSALASMHAEMEAERRAGC